MGQEGSATTISNAASYSRMQQPALRYRRESFDGAGARIQHLAPKAPFTRGFSGIWSTITPIRLCPIPRASQFTVIDEQRQIAYSGFGTSHTGAPLIDLWALDLNIFEWTQIPLKGAPMTPRNGATAVLLNSQIFLFGGFYDTEYLADPFLIDPDTGVATALAQTGSVPSPRSTPLIAVSNDRRLFLWGGFNGQWPSDIHVLNPETMEWTIVRSDEKGRTSVPFVKYENRLVSYGGSNTPGLWVLDMNLSTISLVNVRGPAPPCEVMKAGMVRVGRHLFFFGGKLKNDNDGTILYCLNLVKMNWFVFFVVPDGETVTLADGRTMDGFFMLPTIHTFGLAYSEQNRALVAFLGWPYTDPPRLFVLRIGEAMGVVNLMDDLAEML
jgi:hypothetical protein